jgi:hypothetical protein
MKSRDNSITEKFVGRGVPSFEGQPFVLPYSSLRQFAIGRLMRRKGGGLSLSIGVPFDGRAIEE